jgi:hypothetical protein
MSHTCQIIACPGVRYKPDFLFEYPELKLYNCFGGSVALDMSYCNISVLCLDLYILCKKLNYFHRLIEVLNEIFFI